MTTKPIKPAQQTTPAPQGDRKKIGNFGGSSSTNINIQNNSQEQSLLSQTLEDSSLTETDESEEIPVNSEISPADVATVDKTSFLKVSEPLLAQAVDWTLPSTFGVTLSPEVGGNYGVVFTDLTGQQTVSVNATIELMDGIIDYEVRLIKND